MIYAAAFLSGPTKGGEVDNAIKTCSMGVEVVSELFDIF